MKDRNRVLWIDALCINQDDTREKSVQVAQMAKSYSRADSVRIWLGTGDSNGMSAMGFARNVVDLVQLDQFTKDEKYAPEWDALSSIMKSPWFSRRWVIQELAYAKQASIHNGDESLLWNDFADAVTLFVRNFESIRQLFKNPRVYPDPDHLVDVPALGANALVNANSNLFRRSTATQALAPLASLETLMATLSTFKASDPCDTVYALLSIAKQSSATIRSAELSPNSEADDTMRPALQPIEPDYTKDPREIFIEFTEFCVRSSGSLDILCRPWAPTGKWRHSTFDAGSRRGRNIELPSWIPSLSEAPYGAPEDEVNGRVNGDSFVGLPDDTFYKAAGTTIAWADFGKRSKPVATAHEDSAIEDEANVMSDTAPGVKRKRSAEPTDAPSVQDTLQAPETLSMKVPMIVVEKDSSQPSREIRSPKQRKLDKAAQSNPPSSFQSTLQPHSKASSDSQHHTSNHSSSEGSANLVSPILTAKREVRYDGTLSVKGFQIDSVKKVSPRVPQGVVLRECLEMGGWNAWDNDVLPMVSEELWRTMIADRWDKGRNPPPWYLRACMYCLGRSTTNGDINTGVLIAKEKSSTEVEYLKQVNRTVWNRCFLRTEKNNWYGLGPRKMQEGDIVCILLGCSVPVILRGHESKESYELIGEAYIHTMMDGEALGRRTNDEVEKDCVIYKLR